MNNELRALPFKDLNQLGGHGGCLTYEAKDIHSDQVLILKILDFSHLKSWKNYELFERVAQSLSHLDHPAIPKVLSFDRLESDDKFLSYIALEKMPGESFEQKQMKGWIPSVSEVLDIAIQGFEILDYLHHCNPPVIHRDIKPSNLIFDAKGKVYLIDFGALQQSLDPGGGSTVVGTFGYMPPEQFAGQTTTASDSYSFGVTLIHLLSGISPSEMPTNEDLQLQFESFLSIDLTFLDLLKELTSPDLRHRLSETSDILSFLKDLKCEHEKLAHLTETALLDSGAFSFQIERYKDGFQLSDLLNDREVKKPLQLALKYLGFGVGGLLLIFFSLDFLSLPIQALIYTFLLAGGIGLSQLFFSEFNHACAQVSFFTINPQHITLTRADLTSLKTVAIPLESIVKVHEKGSELWVQTPIRDYCLLTTNDSIERGALKQELLNHLLRHIKS